MGKGNIKGITIEINGDTTGLQKALDGVDKNIRSTQSQLKDVNRLLKLDPSNVELLRQKQDLLQEAIAGTAERLDTLKKAQEQAKQQFENGELGKDKYNALKREVIETENNLKQLQGQLQNTNSAFQNTGSEVENTSNSFDKLKESINQQEKEIAELKEEYANVVLEQGAGSTEAQRLSGRILGLNQNLNENRNTLREVQEQTDSLTESFDDLDEQSEEAGEGFTVFKGALADLTANAISSAIGSVKDFVGSLFELDEATAEYRNMMAKLSGSTQTFGYDANKTMQQYEEFNKYLQDDQASVNCVTNLLGMKASMKTVQDVANASIAVWSAYGDSIPIEGLTESINETAQTASITGNLADALNWATMSQEDWNSVLGEGSKAQQAFAKARKDGETVEDAFNAALGKTNSTQERAQMIADSLNKIYGESKTTYDTVNSSTLEANEAQQELLQTQANLGDAVQPLNTAITNLKTQALDIITPVVQELSYKVQDLLVYLKEHPEVLQALIPIVTGLATSFGILTVALGIQALISGVTKAFTLLNTTMLANPIVLIVTLIAGLAVAITTFIATNEEARKKFFEIWEAIKTAAMNVANAIVQFFTVTIPNAWMSFLNSCKNMINSVINFFKTLGTNISTTVKNIISTIVNWGTNLYSNMTNSVKNAIDSVVKFFTQLPSKIWETLKSVISKITNWGTELIEKGKTTASSFVTTVITFVKELPSKIWSAIVGAVTKVATWGTQMVAKGQSAIMSLVSTVFNTAKQIPNKIWSAIVGAIAKIIAWGAQMVSKASSSIQNVANTINNGLNGVPGKMLSIGKNIVQGLINGITGMAGAIGSAVKNFCSGVVSKFKSAFDIHSPSRIMKKEVGTNIALGVIEGINSKKGITKKTAAEYSELVMSAAEKRLDKYKTYHDMSLKDEVAYWNKIRKATKKGTDAQLSADKKYFEAKANYQAAIVSNAQETLDNYKVWHNLTVKEEMDYWNEVRQLAKKGTSERLELDKKYIEAKKSYNEQVKTLNSQYKADVKAVNDELKQSIKELNQAYKDAVTERTNAILSTFKLFEEYEQKEAVTSDSLTLALTTQVNALKTWRTQLASLKKRNILPEGLVEEISDMGVDATAEIQALNSMTDTELQNYVLLWQQKNKLAKQEAIKELAPMKQETEAQIQALKKAANKELKSLESTYKSDLQSLGSTAYSSAKSAGKKTIKGIVDGIDSMMATLTKSLDGVSTKIQAAYSGTKESTASKASKNTASAKTKSSVSVVTRNVDVSGVEKGINNLAKAVTNQKIVLDTGVVAGAITPTVNKNLATAGRRALRQ